MRCGESSSTRPLFGTKVRGLDALGNQKTVESWPASGNAIDQNTPDGDNEYTARKVLGNTNKWRRADEFTSNTAANWHSIGGASDTFDVNSTNAGCLTITGVGNDTLGGHAEGEPRSVLLWGNAPTSLCQGQLSVTFPSSAPSGAVAGYVFGCKGVNDYWISTFEIGNSTANRVYHVVNGTRLSQVTYSQTCTAGGTYQKDIVARRMPGYTGTGGYPSGQVGVFSNCAGVKFDWIRLWDDSRYTDMAGRYNNFNSDLLGPGVQSIDPTTGRLMLAVDNSTSQRRPVFIKNLRLQKFQATFATRREAGAAASEALRFTFNGTDQDNFDSVTLYHANTATAPSGAKVVEGSDLTSVTGTGTAANVPATTASDVLWYRVQFDGSTLTAKAVKSSTAPTETTWSSTGNCYSSTSFRTTGGLLGFTRDTGSGYLSVDELTVKSYNPATSAYDMTEHYDPFTVDSNGYASDTLTYDNNGNLTYDGSQAYTYDAWNRLMTVSHAYRDASNNLQHGHAVDTMSYDAKGRRVTKAVTGTGSWDCTYHDYYSNQWQLLEERNGSNQPIRQNVWGRTYVDELIQTTASSDPTSGTTTLDHPYYAMQDANWNVLGVVNASGVLTERYEYTPYGMRTCFFSPGSNDVGCYAPTPVSRRLTTASGTSQPWGVCENGHQGLKHQDDVSSTYDRARELVSSLGRFLERDPLTYRDGMSTYTYEISNPVDLIDPSGLRVPDDDMGNPWTGEQWDDPNGNPLHYPRNAPAPRSCCVRTSPTWQVNGFASYNACVASNLATFGPPPWLSILAGTGSFGGMIIGVPVGRIMAPITGWGLGSQIGARAFCGSSTCVQQGTLDCQGNCH